MWQERWPVLFLLGIGVVITMMLGILVVPTTLAKKTVEFGSEYQFVVLTNGLMYYGKMAGLETGFPVLTDIHYVQSATDEKTKQVTNILRKRGQEWHRPDRMILNAQHIIFMESVDSKSKVYTLIQELKNKGENQ